jgi:hypothetical protein
MNTLDFMQTDPEMRVYNKSPRKYASIALQVDLCMAHSRRPCAGGECDEDPCPRHQRTPQVVSRYLRLKLK